MVFSLKTLLLAAVASSTLVAAIPGGYDYNHGKDYDEKKCYTNYITEYKDKVYTKPYTTTEYKDKVKTYETVKTYYHTYVKTKTYTKEEPCTETKTKKEHVTKHYKEPCPVTTYKVETKHVKKVKPVTTCKNEHHYGYKNDNKNDYKNNKHDNKYDNKYDNKKHY